MLKGSFGRELAATARLAGPLIGGQLTMVGMNTIDTVMAGRLDAVALGAVAVGSSVWASIMLFSTGVLMVLAPAIALARDGVIDGLTDLRDEGNDPLAFCIAASDRENLWQCARRQLSDEVYTAMWLRYVEDMSVRDISAVLERSVSWTKVNLMRGRKILDTELGKDATDDKSTAYG